MRVQRRGKSALIFLLTLIFRKGKYSNIASWLQRCCEFLIGIRIEGGESVSAVNDAAAGAAAETEATATSKAGTAHLEIARGEIYIRTQVFCAFDSYCENTTYIKSFVT